MVSPNSVDYLTEPEFGVNPLIASIDDEFVGVWRGEEGFSLSKIRALALQKKFLQLYNGKTWVSPEGMQDFQEFLRRKGVVIEEKYHRRLNTILQGWNIRDPRIYFVLRHFLNVSKSFEIPARRLIVKKDTALKPSKKEIFSRRKAWRALIEARDFQSIQVTARHNQGLYKFLLKFDSVWILEFNSRHKKRRWRNKCRVNYEDEDRKLLEELKTVAGLIMSEVPERRVTRPEIFRRIGKDKRSTLHPELKMSESYLLEISESLYDFKMRKFINYIKSLPGHRFLKSALLNRFHFRCNRKLDDALEVARVNHGLTVRFMGS